MRQKIRPTTAAMPTILDMLYCYYHEYNNTDTEALKTAFEDLYQRMHGMLLREMDWIVDAVCTLCREHEKHEKAGFVKGVKVGIQLGQEQYKCDFSLFELP